MGSRTGPGEEGERRSSEFDTLFVPISCSQCGHPTSVTIAWLKANELFCCSICGGIGPSDRSGYLEAVGNRRNPGGNGQPDDLDVSRGRGAARA